MGNRIKRRILSFVLTLLIVSLFVFSSVSLALGDSSSFVLSDEASSIAVEDYRRTMGLDDNIFIRYNTLNSRYNNFRIQSSAQILHMRFKKRRRCCKN